MPIRSVAVTGATGFIGGAITASLLQQGFQVRALVRPGSSRKPLPFGVERIVGNLDDPGSIESLLRAADAVIHCAGAVRGAHESTFTHTNVDAVNLLVRVAVHEKSIERFILLSSLAATQPQVSPYAASKQAGEAALKQGGSEISWLALRAPAVYGPRDREILPLFKAMSRGIVPVWGESDARFSLLFISDLVAAVSQCLSCATPVSGIYELHDGRSNGYTMDEIIEIVASVLQRRVYRARIPSGFLDIVASANLRLARIAGYQPMLTPWKLTELRHPRWVCDNSGFTAACGWEPLVSLADGLPLVLADKREL